MTSFAFFFLPCSDKGIFTKELDVALLNGSIHIAVHSMKDLPTELPEGLAIGAMCVRGTVEDALVLKAGSGIEPSLDKLPEVSAVRVWYPAVLPDPIGFVGLGGIARLRQK